MDLLTRLEIEAECRRLVLAFARLNDNWDHDGIAAMMTEDATFARPLDPENPIVGREAIRVMFRDRPKRLSRHIMSNIEITATGEDRAEGISTVTFLSSTDHAAPRPVTAEAGIYVGNFADSFVRTAEGWQFAARRGSMALKANVPGPL